MDAAATTTFFVFSLFFSSFWLLGTGPSRNNANRRLFVNVNKQQRHLDGINSTSFEFQLRSGLSFVTVWSAVREYRARFVVQTENRRVRQFLLTFFFCVHGTRLSFVACSTKRRSLGTQRSDTVALRCGGNLKRSGHFPLRRTLMVRFLS